MELNKIASDLTWVEQQIGLIKKKRVYLKKKIIKQKC